MNDVSLLKDTELDGWFVPTRFEEVLYSHLLGNVVQVQHNPLILGIHGPPGHGKTFQCELLLARWNVVTERISGSELESPVAGRPARLIKEKYKSAGKRAAEEGRTGCLIIEDADAGIGDFGEDVTYTVNRQNVSSALMNLCDHPRELEGETVELTPIVFTANYIDTIYTPLIRSQRMRRFYWEMRAEERFEVLTKRFEKLLDSAQLTQLFSLYSDASPAFFSDLWTRYLSERMLGLVPSHRRGDLLQEMSLNPAVRKKFLSQLQSPSDTAFESLLSIATALREEMNLSFGNGRSRSSR